MAGRQPNDQHTQCFLALSVDLARGVCLSGEPMAVCHTQLGEILRSCLHLDPDYLQSGGSIRLSCWRLLIKRDGLSKNTKELKPSNLLLGVEKKLGQNMFHPCHISTKTSSRRCDSQGVFLLKPT